MFTTPPAMGKNTVDMLVIMQLWMPILPLVMYRCIVNSGFRVVLKLVVKISAE